MTDFERRILDLEFNAAAPLLEPWFGKEVLHRTLCGQLAQQLAGARRIHPDEPETNVVHGARFVATTADGHGFIALAQDQSDNEPEAHLMILHASQPLDHADSLEALRQSAATLFPAGTFTRLCFFLHGEQPRNDLPGCTLRSHYVAAPVRTVSSCTPSCEVHPLRVVTPDSMSFYEMYLDWYREFWRQRPELEPLVRVEPEADLVECLNHGGVRILVHDDEPCGVVAAEPRQEFGLTGWRMREKVIAPSFWGRGLSTIANVLFARDLRVRPHDAMWGTITPRNEASLRSALAVGRNVVGSTYWLSM